MTPKKYQSGETDVTARISKIGDGGVRTALYEAANVILIWPVKGSTLKSWGMRLADRAGMRKAKVALARKLAVVLHRMLADGTNFLADKAAVVAAANRKEIAGSGGSRHQPPGARSRRRDDGSGQADDISAGLCYCALLDWPTCSSSDPIRWRPSADPGQKQDTGDRCGGSGFLDSGIS